MWGLFKPKHLYKVVWAYDSQTPYTYTEYIKATDTANAWYKVATKHYAIDCREIVLIDAKLINKGGKIK